MSFRQTLVRLAQHARQPSMRFPDRKAAPQETASKRDDLGDSRPAEAVVDPHSSHSAEPHPCAPQSVIDTFSRFSEARSKPRSPHAEDANSSSYGGPVAQEGVGASASSSGSLAGQGQGASKGVSSGGSGKPGVLEDETQLPAWLRRERWAPTEEEIEAVMTGGAANATPFTKAYQQKWYQPQF
ncbi:hypothetical protein NBRC10512_000131 [Rhodotorula toruloides]|uniref:Uncharacterized protein n=1 Tax=Rhodotorula toruloides (strain NP11) TaxID=1130832 RepID=M7XJC9_RHOT1|nr:protein of unknown function DUF2638 [Rhodotorula toruloides NP11]EMS20258.1 protein of unknown function DUF2638 [Rhodotorula toruloides NP11]